MLLFILSFFIRKRTDTKFLTDHEYMLLIQQIQRIPATRANGGAWYKWMFSQVPDLRKFFVGAHEINPNDVPANERFQKQGCRLLAKLRSFVLESNNPESFDILVTDLSTDHIRRFKIPAELYPAFGGLFQAFVEQKAGMTDEQRTAWEKLFAHLSAVAKTCYK